MPWPKEEFADTKGDNQNPYIEEQTTHWPKEKVQKDKQRSTKHAYKSKDRVTRTPLKTGGELWYPEGYAVPTPLVTPVKDLFLSRHM